MRLTAPVLLTAALTVFAAVPARAEFLLGLVAANELVGTNLEWAGEASSTYVVLGAYQAKTGFNIEDLTGYVGHRRYAGGVFGKDTFFGGFFLGDVGGGPTFNRIGAGGEVGYQWITENLRVSLQAGVAILGEASGTGAPTSTDPVPQSFIGAGASIRY